MKLDAIELRRVCLPLVQPFRTSSGTQAIREALLVRIETDLGQGWGECVAGSAPVYSAEYVDSAWLTLRRHLVPQLLDARDVTAARVQPLLQRFKGHRMAKGPNIRKSLNAWTLLRSRGP